MKMNVRCRGLWLAVALVACAGCLSARRAPVANWLVETPSGAASAASGREALALRELRVRAPYDSTAFVVLRENGSVAFDAANAFAARPALMLAEAAREQLKGNAADAPGPATDVLVTRLALDCRSPGRRQALVELRLTAGKGAPDRRTAAGRAAVDVARGNYTEAFSRAFAAALAEAVGSLGAARQ